MLSWLSFTNPWLLVGGALVASPILIHLLNRRRFRVRFWAAMDFLLEADRRNRRRIRLENLLLLALRCLAVLLLALLVSRPFLRPAGLAAALPSLPFERIVVLDDSPSMAAVAGNKTAFEQARTALGQFIRELSAQRPGDTLTLLTTSRPDQPRNTPGEPLGSARVEQLLGTVEALAPGDLPARWDRALAAVEALLQQKPGHRNRAVYLISDLRANDWKLENERGAATPLAAALQRAGRLAAGLFVVDVGDQPPANISVAEIKPLDGTVAAGVEARFEVTLVNHGDLDADDVEVAFRAQGATELRGRAPLIEARGGKATVPFTYVFREPGSTAVEAQIPADALAADNTRYYAARVKRGVEVLLVDGDPGGEPERSEVFFLERALRPPGDVLSGNVVQVVTEGPFEALPLDRFQAVFLCNPYRLSDDRRKALDQWVKAGGGLVLFLGDQVDAENCNESLHAAGQGLLPLKLGEVRGDDQRQQWVGLNLEKPGHPLLRVFDGAQNPFLKSLKVFRHWTSVLPPELAKAGQATVLATFTDPEGSPAVVESTYGQGRVLTLLTTADADWTNWPGDPSYVVTMLEAARHVARRAVGESDLGVGQPIRVDLDPSRYQTEARVVSPGGESAAVTATASDAGRLTLDHADTARAGLYTLELTTRGDEKEALLFAANIDPAEGDLRRADPADLRRRLGEGQVDIVRGGSWLLSSAASSGHELWRYLVVAAAAVLGVELFLAWGFARKR